MAEYAFVYGLPDPEMPWPLFLGLVKRVARFDARVRLRLFDSVSAAIAIAFGGDDRGVRQELLEGAYALKDAAPTYVKNLARKEPEDA